MLVMIGVVAASASASGSATSVGAQAAFTIPALTRLAWSGEHAIGQGLSATVVSVSVEIRATTAHASGWVEMRKAVVLVVRSNVSWTLVVRAPEPLAVEGVGVRTGRGEYRPVRPEGLVLAQGSPGVHEIVLDYQVDPSSEAGRSGGRTLTLLYSVEG